MVVLLTLLRKEQRAVLMACSLRRPFNYLSLKLTLRSMALDQLVRNNHHQKPRTNAEIPFKKPLGLAKSGLYPTCPCPACNLPASSSTPFIALFAIAKNRSRDVPPKSLLSDRTILVDRKTNKKSRGKLSMNLFTSPQLMIPR